jgi:galactonate dehydratase
MTRFRPDAEPEIRTRRGFLRAAAGGLIGASAFPALAQQRDASPLKITRVEPYVLRIGERTSYPCVRIETADGIHGWGEGTTPPSTPAVIAQIRECGKLIMNQSAWDIEKLWRHMYIVEENTLGGTLYAAISAIDIALWDIIGKKLNVPVYKLLGGKTRDKIRIYTSYRWGNIPRTREAYAKRTKELIAQGATAGKYDPFGPYPGFDRQLSTPILNEVREMVQGIREGGPAFDICIECHGKWNVASAGRIIKMLEPFDPFFVEEPVPPENTDAMAMLQRSTNMPIATGEGLQTQFNFYAILEKRAARILQPDPARTGGITALKKIAAMADAHYVTIAPHNPNGPACTAAALHLATSIPNFVIMEEGNTNPTDYNDIFVGGWKPTLAEWSVPEAPGLGIDFSPQFVKDRAVGI